MNAVLKFRSGMRTEISKRERLRIYSIPKAALKKATRIKLNQCVGAST